MGISAALAHIYSYFEFATTQIIHRKYPRFLTVSSRLILARIHDCGGLLEF